MSRNDGVDRTAARNQGLTDKAIARVEGHNERLNITYTNPDIVPERTPMNVHYKAPAASYAELFAEMERSGAISTRGLKPDAIHCGELVFDVNTAYFHNHGGYEFAKQFYADAYRAAVEIVGGEEYILSAVMHADERNRRMSEALGYDVYHYHLHVVYVPVVEKQIRWSKRCRDPALRGTVKETIMQVSHSKKWQSDPVPDESGKPLRGANGKVILNKSYSVLQDRFYDHMAAAGYTDIRRGEKGSTEEHLTVLQFKAMKEEERLAELEAQEKAALADAEQAELLTAEAKQAQADAEQAAKLAQERSQAAQADAEQAELLTVEAKQAQADAEEAAKQAQERSQAARTDAEQAELMTAEAKQAQADAEEAAKQAQARLDRLTGDMQSVEAFAEKLGDPETLLPPPAPMQSAKSYRERIVLPVVKKLVNAAVRLFRQLCEERREKDTLRRERDRAADLWKGLTKEVAELQTKSAKLDRLCKKLGPGEVERLVNEKDRPKEKAKKKTVAVLP